MHPVHFFPKTLIFLLYWILSIALPASQFRLSLKIVGYGIHHRTNLICGGLKLLMYSSRSAYAIKMVPESILL